MKKLDWTRLPPAELTVFALATAFYTVMAAPGVG